MSKRAPLDAELILDVGKPIADPLSAIDLLYSSKYHGVCAFERDMHSLHTDYLALISPVAAELCRRTAQGRIIMGDDFLNGFHARSAYIAEEARRLRISFERQHRAAIDLAKLL